MARRFPEATAFSSWGGDLRVERQPERHGDPDDVGTNGRPRTMATDAGLFQALVDAARRSP
jgi:hypothetical protein